MHVQTIAYGIGRSLLMRVDIQCAKFQDENKTLRKKKKKKYWQNFYGIFHLFRDLNVCFRIKSMQEV